MKQTGYAWKLVSVGSLASPGRAYEVWFMTHFGFALMVCA